MPSGAGETSFCSACNTRHNKRFVLAPLCAYSLTHVLTRTHTHILLLTLLSLETSTSFNLHNRTTDEHMANQRSSKKSKVQEHDYSEQDEQDPGPDLVVDDVLMDAQSSGSPLAWSEQGLTFQLFQICSFFMYVVYSYNLSDAALELFLPLLTLYAPELASFTAHSLKGLLGIGQHTFQKYAVCPSCASLKSLQELKLDPVCRFDPFANGKPCNTNMGRQERSVLTGMGDVKPLKTFAFSGVRAQLQRMLARPGFAEKLELWRHRRIPSGTLADVYDGLVWRDFMTYDGSPFLAAPGNLALQLNFGRFSTSALHTDTLTPTHTHSHTHVYAHRWFPAFQEARVLR